MSIFNVEFQCPKGEAMHKKVPYKIIAAKKNSPEKSKSNENALKNEPQGGPKSTAGDAKNTTKIALQNRSWKKHDFDATLQAQNWKSLIYAWLPPLDIEVGH